MKKLPALEAADLRAFSNELIQDLIDHAVDYGSNPTEENEANLSLVSELVYNMLNLLLSTK